MEMDRTCSKNNGLNGAQSGNQGEGRDLGNGQVEDGKMTKQGRMEPPGTGMQWTEDNGRH